MAERAFRIHFLVPVEEGPIHSAPDGNEALKIPKGGRKFRCACNPNLELSLADRGTNLPWGVRCSDCIRTEIFQAKKRMKPGVSTPDHSEAVDNGCCG